MINSNKTLITGATGFIGKYLVNALVGQKRDVRCLARKSSNKQFLKSLDELGVEIIFGDLLDKESFSVGPDCQIDDSAKLEDWAVIGEQTILEEDVEIRRSILWDEVRVRKGAKVIDSVVTSFRTVDRDLIQKTY